MYQVKTLTKMCQLAVRESDIEDLTTAVRESDIEDLTTSLFALIWELKLNSMPFTSIPLFLQCSSVRITIITFQKLIRFPEINNTAMVLFLQNRAYYLLSIRYFEVLPKPKRRRFGYTIAYMFISTVNFSIRLRTINFFTNINVPKLLILYLPRLIHVLSEL